ncbi:hypothetical protein [Yinghuangia seranimata]|uniref:hypothetical protein n=1 Tax=Yinghuangia seranimata TaxID=408067 RepID=UPI00248CD49F|nr:hypothetical protein [Yinghuangia seranimata]MDI2132476.1 hypothetical protein [Yinghuangia seranimata]
MTLDPSPDAGAHAPPETTDMQLRFRVPTGFIPIDLDPDVEGMKAVFDDGKEYLTPEQADDWATGVQAMLFSIERMRMNNTVFYAIGAHLDDQGGVATAALSVTVEQSPAPGLPPEDVAALVLRLMEGTFGPESGGLVALGAGPAAAATSVLTYPGIEGGMAPIDEDGNSSVAQARIVIPFPDGNFIATLDMATAHVEHAESYGDVLYHFANELAFVLPDEAPVPEPEPGGVVAAIKNVLG